MKPSTSLRGALALGAISMASALALACTQQSNVAGGFGSGSNAYAASRATEPRTGDPTASEAPPSPTATPTAGVSLSSANAPTSPSSAAKPTTTPKNDPLDRPKQISARHVLVQWIGTGASSSVLRSREQALAIAEEVLAKAKAGQDLGRLAVEYSDEPNAGTRGGSLGRFPRGAMVPAFEEAAFALDVGQISGIVETPFGFHVIQRTE